MTERQKQQKSALSIHDDTLRDEVKYFTENCFYVLKLQALSLFCLSQLGVFELILPSHVASGSLADRWPNFAVAKTQDR